MNVARHISQRKNLLNNLLDNPPNDILPNRERQSTKSVHSAYGQMATTSGLTLDSEHLCLSNAWRCFTRRNELRCVLEIGEKSAIVIHDPNEKFRCSVDDGRSGKVESWEWETQRGDFEEFCKELLSADPAAGELIVNPLQLVSILLILCRFCTACAALNYLLGTTSVLYFKDVLHFKST